MNSLDYHSPPEYTPLCSDPSIPALAESGKAETEPKAHLTFKISLNIFKSVKECKG